MREQSSNRAFLHGTIICLILISHVFVLHLFGHVLTRYELWIHFAVLSIVVIGGITWLSLHHFPMRPVNYAILAFFLSLILSPLVIGLTSQGAVREGGPLDFLPGIFYSIAFLSGLILHVLSTRLWKQ